MYDMNENLLAENDNEDKEQEYNKTDEDKNNLSDEKDYFIQRNNEVEEKMYEMNENLLVENEDKNRIKKTDEEKK